MDADHPSIGVKLARRNTAAQAGMGVLVQPRSMAPPGLKEIPAERLPLLEDVEFVLVPRRGADGAVVEALSNLVAGQMFGDRSKASHNIRE